MKVLTMPGMVMLQRLRQDDKPHHQPVAQAERMAPSYWPFGIACRPPRTTSAM